MISPANFQPPNPSIKAINCISRFSCFRDFAGDIIMNHVIDFLLIKLDMKEKV